MKNDNTKCSTTKELVFFIYLHNKQRYLNQILRMLITYETYFSDQIIYTHYSVKAE